MGKRKDSKQYKTRTQLLEENAQLRQEISELKHENMRLRTQIPDLQPGSNKSITFDGQGYPISGIDEIP